MGHMTLVAEEIVKLFEHYPAEIHAIVEPHIPQPAWDRYVATTLRETRERDLSPLGGGITVGPHDTSSSTSQSLSDEDDEFPMNHTRVLKAMEADSPLGGGAAASEGARGGHAPPDSSTEAEEPSGNDRVRHNTTLVAVPVSSDSPLLSSHGIWRTPCRATDPTSFLPMRRRTKMGAGSEGPDSTLVTPFPSPTEAPRRRLASTTSSTQASQPFAHLPQIATT